MFLCLIWLLQGQNEGFGYIGLSVLGNISSGINQTIIILNNCEGDFCNRYRSSCFHVYTTMLVGLDNLGKFDWQVRSIMLFWQIRQRKNHFDKGDFISDRTDFCMIYGVLFQLQRQTFLNREHQIHWCNNMA